MTNDPDDRFMISDLSSKLSAYINGEDNASSSLNTDSVYKEDQSGDNSQRQARNSGRGLAGRNSLLGRGNAGSPPVTQVPRTDRNIEDALAAEIKPRNEDVRTPADTMFSDLDQALDTHEDTIRNKQIRQQQLREKQLRQKQLQEEQLRQKQLQEEQLRQKQLKEAQAAARIFAKSLYTFDPEQPYQSLYSGHTVRFAEMPVKKKEVPQRIVEAASADSITESRADSNTSYRDDTAVTAASVIGSTEESPLFTDDFPSETQLDPPAGTTFDPYTDFSDNTEGSSRRGSGNGGRTGFIIAAVCALLVGAALFFLIRNYSSKIMGLISGTHASGTASVAESATGSDAGESVEDEDKTKTDSAALQESVQPEGTEEPTDTAFSENENEEPDNGETAGTEDADAEDTDVTVSGEAIPEDPNDIAYLASVNEKASSDAIAELTPEAPRLYLSSYAVKIHAGARFNALSFVENIEDDRDGRDRLFGDISVDGLSEFDANVPGTYELIFYCYDSSANRSNKAKMTVIVE